MIMQLLLLLLFIGVPTVYASSEHDSKYLLEFTGGEVWTKDGSYAEAGLDWEYFPENFHHKVSFGISSEYEFEHQKEIFAGPLVSFYFQAFKFYFTSGLQGRGDYWRIKSRLGVGYDFEFKDKYLIVPNITSDFIDDEIHPGVSLGLARLF